MIFLKSLLTLPILYAFILIPLKADNFSIENFNKTTANIINNSQRANLQALDLLENIFSLEESLLYPENDQLLVLMKQELGAQILLQKINLFIDGELVKSYSYKGNDLEKLMSRGVLRFVTLLVPPGIHRIDVEMFSLSHKPIKRKLIFKKYSRPQFLSLSLVGTQISLTEWQAR